MTDAFPGTTAAQRELLTAWLPGAELVRDHSWGQVDRAVLHVRTRGEDVIVKAGGPSDGHMARELRAHREWVAPLADAGLAPALRYADDATNLLVTGYLPGELVLGHPAQLDPETFRQAGAILALLHGQHSAEDADWCAREREHTLAWLDRPHRVDPGIARDLAAEVGAWQDGPMTVVPTHGDWQPRNWLVNGGRILAIDFGRAALRPATEDFTRLAAQDFAGRPDLEDAFLAGYGHDPRSTAAWRRARIAQALGTAVWAHAIGDEPFEAQGHAMLADLYR